MNIKIDLKSALAGLVAGVIITFSVGAASSSGPLGRYQIAGTPGHGMVLDTVTGQVWGKFLPDSSGVDGLNDADFAKPKLGRQ